MKNLLFLLLFLGIIGCSDDDISGSIYGTVFTEEEGVPVNATMLLYKLKRYRQDKNEYERWIVDQQKKADDNGYYEFGNLSPVENYQLRAELEGYVFFSSDILLKSERMNVDVFLEKVDTTNFVVLKDAGIAVQKLDISTGRISQELAERLCAESIVGGHKDWRLPTLSEWTSMYNNKSLLPGIKNGNCYYWTSTLKKIYGGTSYYYMIYMGNGNITTDKSYQFYNSNNYNNYYARCVRSIQL